MKLLIFKIILINSLLSFCYCFELKQTTYLSSQFAGELGKYSFGMSIDWKDWFNQSLHYGFVPEIDNVDTIHIFSLKNNFFVYGYDWPKTLTRLYIALNISRTLGSKYRTNALSGVPDGYYRQSATRAHLGFGVDFLRHQFKEAIFYFESTVNDVWLINRFNNSSIRLYDHASLAVGIRYRI